VRAKWKEFRYRLEWVALAVVAKLIPLLSRKACYRLGQTIGSLAARFDQRNHRVALSNLEAAFGDVRQALQSEPAGPQDPPADSAQRLIEKMANSGQLKPGFLMRVLSQGQMDLFDLGFARLVGLDVTRFRKAFYDRGVRPMALACHGAAPQTDFVCENTNGCVPLDLSEALITFLQSADPRCAPSP